jgi:hypothetical protein
VRNLKDDESKIKALDELFNEVGVYRKSQDLKKLFDFIKRFPDIAPYNAMLINIQKPGSQYVATAAQWRNRFGRTIKPSGRPLVILQPFGPVRFIYELGDTEGSDPFPDELLNPFRTEGQLPKGTMPNLRWNLPRDGIAYYEADHGTVGAGFIQITEKGKRRGLERNGLPQVKVFYEMVVNRNLTDSTKFVTVLHELAHLYCGHLGTPDEKWHFWPKRLGLVKNVKEFEAESVAWLVCERLGINNPSASYLSGYVNENDEIPNISLETVLKAVNIVESMIHRHLELRKDVLCE